MAVTEYDVFLSHSSKDKNIVRRLAERLRNDGIHVWFDEWTIKPGDSIPIAVSNGLQNSRVLVLVLSENFFASEWATFEHHTFLFRDPTNRMRRFIPIRLDSYELPITLQQFAWLDWSKPNDEVYKRILNACHFFSDSGVDEQANYDKENRTNTTFHRGSKSNDLQTRPNTKRSSSVERFHEAEQIGFGLQNDRTSGCSILGGHGGSVSAVTFSPNCKIIATGANDHVLRLWSTETEKCLGALEGHEDKVLSVAFSPDGRSIVSGSWDKTLRLWDVDTGRCIATFSGHLSMITTVAFSPDGRSIVSGSWDKTLRLWNVDTGRCIATFSGHRGEVNSVGISPDGRFIVSGGQDCLLYLWALNEKNPKKEQIGGASQIITSLAFSPDGNVIASGGYSYDVTISDRLVGNPIKSFSGHSGVIHSLAFSPDGRSIVSGSWDKTLRLWDVDTGRCIAILEGHTGRVSSVAFSSDGQLIASGAEDRTLRLWNLATLGLVDNVSVMPTGRTYVNARVLLVGDSGVGKSGLAYRLTENNYRETDSTDGAWATIVSLPDEIALAGEDKSAIQQEIWLWDFAGQNDYRLLHQLFMDDTALAILVFNPQNEKPFEGLGQWDRDIRRAAGGNYSKLLVAGRCDRGTAIVSQRQIEQFMTERGFVQYIPTSAKTGDGCSELLDAIRRHIDFSRLARTISPHVFRRLKEEIIRLRDNKIVLLRREELRQRLELLMPDAPFSMEQFETVISLLASPGILWKLDFGDFVLLQPEQISAYAGALVRTVRSHPDEIGCISEEDFLEGKLDFQDRSRLPCQEETIVLVALYQTLLKRGLCFKQPGDNGVILVFPSLFRLERPMLAVHPPAFVTYRFSGMLADIYATLVIRLIHTSMLEKDSLWRNAADFKTVLGQRVGIKVTLLYEGESELTVYCDPSIAIETRIAFMLYIDDHIRARATDVKRSRHYTCPHCNTPAENYAAIAKRLEHNFEDMLCAFCEKRILLKDVIEKRFGSESVRLIVDSMNLEAEAILDAQNKEQILVGEVGAIAGKAGQVFRPTSNADYGIDGEIEFKTAGGTATGKRIYVQLKSGDSHLRFRKYDGVEVFDITHYRHIDYWKAQAYDVYLIIRNDDGRIRWMNITAYLKRQRKPSKQIVFTSREFNPTGLLRLRDQTLSNI